MKKYFTRLLFVSILFISFSIPQLYAQIGVRSISVGAGIYNPSMDYWNENALSSWGSKFESGFFATGNIELNIMKILSLRAGAGYWTQTLTQTDIPVANELRSDEITIQLLPVTIDLLIRTPEEFSKLYSFYGGIGVGVNFINMTYAVTIPSLGTLTDELKGEDFISQLIVGGEYKIIEDLAIGAEFRYLMGNYDQEVKFDTGIETYKVSINGPQFVGMLKYFLDYDDER
ncbi:MAG: outer membrane beta-barrel protein [Bacteroidetes bacterium]|nr:outer membrane beta-barrel protein [Bacteroidota bacterium]